jgi:hypothetical protein
MRNPDPAYRTFANPSRTASFSGSSNSRTYERAAGPGGLGGFGPVDALGRIHRRGDIGAEIEQPEYLIRLETDIRVDEQEVRGRGVFEKMRHNVLANACD